jgi:hypothetical protein
MLLDLGMRGHIARHVRIARLVPGRLVPLPQVGPDDLAEVVDHRLGEGTELASPGFEVIAGRDDPILEQLGIDAHAELLTGKFLSDAFSCAGVGVLGDDLVGGTVG